MNMNVFSGAAAGVANAYKDFVNTDSIEKATAVLSQKTGEMEDAQLFSKQVDPEEAGDIIQSRTKSMSELPKPAKAKEVDKTKAVEDKVVNKEDELDKEAKAKAFKEGKPEFSKKALEELHDKIKDDDTPESIIAKVEKSFPKGLASQISDALEFLTTSIKDPKTKGIVEKAKAQYDEQNKDAIPFGREMTNIAYKAADIKGGSIKEAYGIFVDFVANKNKTIDTYKQLCAAHPIYKDLFKEIKHKLSQAGNALHNGQIDPLFMGDINNMSKDIQSISMTFLIFKKGMPRMDKQVETFIKRYEGKEAASAA